MEKKPQLFVLLFLVSFASVGAVLFSPGLPQMARDLAIPRHLAQLTVSMFLIGYAFGQLPWGPLANRFRRKPTLFFGISIQILGALSAALAGFAAHYPSLLVSIFVMALGSSVGLKITFTMIGDSFPLEDAKKKIAYVGLSFALAPAIGVVLGGFIVEWINWQSCFLFLALYGVFLFSLSTFLPETGEEKDFDALKIKQIYLGFLDELKNKRLLICAFLWGFNTSVISLFTLFAPFIAMNQIGIQPNDYGLMNCIPLPGVVFGLFLARYLFEKMETLKILLLGIGLLIAGVAFQLSAFALGHVNLFSLFGPMILLYVGGALIFTNVSALAMSQVKNKSYASALTNFLNLGTALLMTLIASSIQFKTATVLPSFYLGLTLFICLLTYYFSKQFSTAS